MRIVDNNVEALVETLASSLKASAIYLRDMLAGSDVSWFSPLSATDIDVHCIRHELGTNAIRKYRDTSWSWNYNLVCRTSREYSNESLWRHKIYSKHRRNVKADKPLSVVWRLYCKQSEDNCVMWCGSVVNIAVITRPNSMDQRTSRS